MPRAKWMVVMSSNIVVISKVTKKRYVFTRRKRELEIDEVDVDQFRAVIRRVSSCGCKGGSRLEDKELKVFEVT